MDGLVAFANLSPSIVSVHRLARLRREHKDVINSDKHEADWIHFELCALIYSFRFNLNSLSGPMECRTITTLC